MEAKTDIVLNINGGLYLRIASTKEVAPAKVFAKTLIDTLTPLLKDGVTLAAVIMPSRFAE
jgi:hypothetical protein